MVLEDRRLFVYDIEVFKGVFTYSAINIDTEEIVRFVIHKDRDERFELLKHLKECRGQIGYNNISYDYVVIHYLLELISSYHQLDAWDIIDRLYTKSSNIINDKIKDGFQNHIKTSDYKIQQLDLYRIWHYDNKNRRTSLKALEISMNYPNVMECEIPFDKEDITPEDIEEILKYNENDILATYEFYKKTVQFGKLDLRKSIKKKFKLDCLNWNNGKIGEQLILKLYCKLTNKDPYKVKELRTFRSVIKLKDCIPSNIKFETKEFNNLLNFFNNKEITDTNGGTDYTVIYKEHKYDFGSGGVHGLHKPGVYISDDKYVIKSLDVASLYPNLPIVYGFYPQHLGPKFLEVYRDNIVNVRLAEKAKPKHEQDKSIVDGYKEAANVPYGKSNSIYSFLFDSLFTMKTTISGQLVISMLCERLSAIPDSQMLMSNTDGCEIIIPRVYEQMYSDICKQWELETKLVLEFADYEKMWIRDINNYGCLDTKGKIKNKGSFEVDKVIGNEPAYHKDNSFKIIPFALQEYFTKGTPVETTIKNHKEIYDFCGRQKFKGEDIGEIHYIKDNQHIVEKQQKNTRYYISTNGSTFIKKYAKGSIEKIHVGRKVTIFNKYTEKEDYNIDYNFYILEARKEIQLIETNQMSLF